MTEPDATDLPVAGHAHSEDLFRQYEAATSTRDRTRIAHAGMRRRGRLRRP
jgi:hypothetical protein